MNGHYVGRLPHDDPLHGMLDRIVRDRCGIRHPEFRVFRLSGSNEVYAYQERASDTRLIGKFFGTRFGWDRDRAVRTAAQEYDGLQTLRRYDLVGSPHHVIAPFGLERDLNCALVLEYYTGERLGDALTRAVYRRDPRSDRHLYRRLTALGYYLATQHNRTAEGSDVDFDADCRYLTALLGTLRERRRIGHWDVDELTWLCGLWRVRPRMWADRPVLLHGDATPANFLFGGGLDVGVIDLERSHRGDRMFDVGRVAGELQHAFMSAGDRWRAEPFIGHFCWEYSCHFPDRDAAFRSITARLPFYMAVNLLRIARNDWIDRGYAGRLVAQAKELLRSW